MQNPFSFLDPLFDALHYLFYGKTPTHQHDVSPRRIVSLISGIIVLALLYALLSGCATLSDPAKPRNEAEQFPLRNQDPRVGLIVNSGTAPMNLYIYDQANRLVEQIYLSGAERHIVSYNGQPYPQYWARKFEQGCYRVDAIPFYHAVKWVPPMMVRIDLPKQTVQFCVGNNPTAQYYGGSHWGWLLFIGADIQPGANGFPLIQVINPFR